MQEAFPQSFTWIHLFLLLVSCCMLPSDLWSLYEYATKHLADAPPPCRRRLGPENGQSFLPNIWERGAWQEMDRGENWKERKRGLWQWERQQSRAREVEGYWVCQNGSVRREDRRLERASQDMWSWHRLDGRLLISNMRLKKKTLQHIVALNMSLWNTVFFFITCALISLRNKWGEGRTTCTFVILFTLCDYVSV